MTITPHSPSSPQFRWYFGSPLAGLLALAMVSTTVLTPLAQAETPRMTEPPKVKEPTLPPLEADPNTQNPSPLSVIEASKAYSAQSISAVGHSASQPTAQPNEAITPIAPVAGIIAPPVNPNQPPEITYRPYNTGQSDINLWEIENKRLLYSPAVLSPSRQLMAYSQVLFDPRLRQVYSRLYLSTLPPEPQAPLGPPSPEDIAKDKEEVHRNTLQFWKKGSQSKIPPITPLEIQKNQRLDPRFQGSPLLLTTAGGNHSKRYRFETLTIVDWSPDGQRLLFKRKSGKLYHSLKTTDLAVYDLSQGVISIYPELKRILPHYWDPQRALEKPLNNMEWDIFPLGWASGSGSDILFKAWAFTGKEKFFLGIWQYNIGEEKTTLMSLKDIPLDITGHGKTPELTLNFNPDTGQWQRKPPPSAP